MRQALQACPQRALPEHISGGFRSCQRPRQSTAAARTLRYIPLGNSSRGEWRPAGGGEVVGQGACCLHKQMERGVFFGDWLAGRIRYMRCQYEWAKSIRAERGSSECTRVCHLVSVCCISGMPGKRAYTAVSRMRVRSGQGAIMYYKYD